MGRGLTTERNRACRIAYRHARAGEESLARRWRDVAEQFAPLSKRQERHLDDLLAEASPIHPDQLALVHVAPVELAA